MSERVNHSEQGILFENLRARLADYYLERNPGNGPVQALKYASESTNLLLRQIINPHRDNPEKYCKRVWVKITQPGLQTDRFLTREGINLVLEAEKPEDVGGTHLLSEENLQAINDVLKKQTVLFISYLDREIVFLN